MKLISIVTACFNEEENVEDLSRRIKEVMAGEVNYDYEHIFIDNASRDNTPKILRQMAAADHRIKVILNTRNFGQVRSPHHALLQTSGDACIMMVADLQDPPEMIPALLRKWEEGSKIVLAIKSQSEESSTLYLLRTIYYRMLRRFSEVELVEHATGSGLYDRAVVDILRRIRDPYPYFRGLIADIGFEPAKVHFDQPRRKRGLSKNNFYSLFDLAMLGFTNHSKVPLRLATLFGFFSAMASLGIGLVYLIRKLLNWDAFTLGMAPAVVGIFLFFSINLIFLGIIGEYVGAILTQTLDRPLIVEKERINFSQPIQLVNRRALASHSPDEDRGYDHVS